MAPASILVAETERLEALRAYGVLDTEPEVAFDRLAQLAAEVMGTPVALISLVDADRQWFKARVGLDICQTSRDSAFCAHAINETDPLVVEDARLDPRFATNPLVLGPPMIRFYAGAQIRSASGHAIGTICAIDVRPRVMTPDKIRHLQGLAAAVVTTLELHRTMRDIVALASIDRLTGLANRARLARQLVAIIAERPRAPSPFSLVYVDCDDFCGLNDTLGHAAGDELLKSLATALPDWVRHGDLAARLDGDEFAVLLPGADEAAAAAVADRILRSGQILMARNNWAVTLSIGAATFRDPPANADEALAVAESAMDQAKLAGKDQIHILPTSETAATTPPLAGGRLHRSLRAGLERGEIFLQYQPIEPLKGCHGGFVEALVRWNHPTLGVLPPSSFIAASERSGLILPLGSHILTLALVRMRQWLEDGTAPSRVSVNVSGVQIRSSGFAEGVLAALDAAGVAADRLEIELTEGHLIDGSPGALRSLTDLAAAGVRLAVDDFGTGYSSLRYLRDLPVHTLKIDRGFIQNIAGNPRDASIVAAIIAMARTLGLETVAEGIEDATQRDLLTDMGVDFGQGWLFGRPRGAAAVQYLSPYNTGTPDPRN
jgi:diguanylate cyclase (GGDEF)-like protein